ncbi:serine/threonine protein kinase [Streptomyces mesophilus]|uniref:serine/threonine protein kinase n=1 Tax=Streptomyces mesophilus TaxID=1775132 RepID=UPI001F43F6C9|nr:protein kinase [Streptomyces mesophilus]
MTYGVELPGRIGPYTVERELGAGGMGMVYQARSRGGRTVAVKVARPELAADPHFRARFRAEVEAARKVGGFHTAQVVDADPDADTPWLATAYVAGPTLAGLIDRQGPMNETRLRSLGAALAEALQAIHNCGLIHRDLKPGNIIMAEDGPRVLDFGIARAVESTRLTSTGAAFGTPGFLAPEQAQGLEVGPAADVFALGAVLVAAAGGSAFGAGTPMGLMYRSVHETPDLSSVPEGMRRIVTDCLAKDPAARPTPERLLDLFAPQPSAQPQPPTHPPTVAVSPAQPTPVAAPSPAVSPHAVSPRAASSPGTPAPSAPTAGRGGEDAATAGGLHHLATRPAPAGGSPSSTPSRTARNWRIAIAACVFVAGGFLATKLAGGTPDTGGDGEGGGDQTFPAAAYEITRPTQLLDGAYKLQTAVLQIGPDKLQDDATRQDAFELTADYKGTRESSFDTVVISAEYGSFKKPGDRMLRMIANLDDTDELTESEEPLEKVRVPGSKTEFSCREFSSRAGVMCAWADQNTIAVLQFEGYDALKLAAEEAAGIREDIRRPVNKPGS